MSNLEDLDHLYDTVNQEKGRIDILIANAGVMDHFDKTFNVNVKGLLFTVQKALPLFQDDSSIILFGSVGGSKALSVYNATKAAV